METKSTPTGADVAAQIPRNIAIGIALMVALTFAGCLVAGLDPLPAIGVALLPSFLFGPFVGGMITVAAYRHVEGAE